MSTITRERAQEIFLGNGPEPTASEERELARIALASLEAEPVCVIDQSNLDYLKSGSDADVWPASRTEMGDVLLYRAAPPAPVSVPDYPEVLPCPVMLEPGLRFGKGVPTTTMLGALQRRAEYYAEIDAMTPEQRAKHDAGMKEFAAMLQGAEPVTTAYKLRYAVETIRNSGIEINAEKIFAERDALNSPVIPDGWKLVPIVPTEKMVIEGFESEPDEFFSKSEVWEAYQKMSGCEQAAHRAKLCWAAMITAAPKQEVEL